jgi:dihydrofolate reductase
MSSVVVNATMSIDGFVADDQDGVGELFGWYGNGDTVVETTHEELRFSLTPQDAEFFRDLRRRLGALVVGRRLFDLTDGWGGTHPLGVPVVVLTHEAPREWIEAHPDAPFTFVTEGGVHAAVTTARTLAGEAEVIGVAAGNVGSQAIDEGLVDQVVVDLAPVLLGSGRPYFDSASTTPVRLGEPRIVQGAGVVHLVYDVQEHSAAEATWLPT